MLGKGGKGGEHSNSIGSRGVLSHVLLANPIVPIILLLTSVCEQIPDFLGTDFFPPID